MARKVESADELLRRYDQGERDFSEADLRDASLRWAELTGVKLAAAKLSGAKLWGADLSGADLSEADLREVRLSGANLSGANLTGARFGGADLRRANLRAANLSGARLSGADLRHAFLGYAALSNAHLDRADLSGVYLRKADLRAANLRGVNLRGANLRKADLGEADLSEADLTEADLREANLVGVNLSGVDLSFPKLHGANLREVNLRGHDLRGADLRCVDLRGVDLSEADLRFAQLEDADLSGAVLDGCALGAGTDLLAANWQTLTVSGTTYNRAAVERGDQVLPIGQPTPLRFVFGVDGELDGDDLLAVREVIRSVLSARGTKVKLEVSESGDVLLVEGLGSTRQAGQAGVLFQLVQHAVREGLRAQPHQTRDDQRSEPGQQLMALVTGSLENEGLLRLVGRLDLREIELRTAEEVGQFERLVNDRRLARRVTIIEQNVRFAKAFAATPKARDLLLSFLGLDQVAKAFQAQVDAARAAARRESE
jgi:uncharacterized protein YjbI with pentapeptide repeats